MSSVQSGLVGFGSRAFRDDPDEGLVNRENLGYAPMELFLIESHDRGKTWTMPRRISPPLVGPTFEACHNIVELPSGRWLAPTSTWRGWNGELPGGRKTVVLISEDQGPSWPDYGVVFDGTEEGTFHWEQSVVPLGNDNVLSLAWVHHPPTGGNLPNRFTVSRDGGRTFDPPPRDRHRRSDLLGAPAERRTHLSGIP